ncbi:MAG TPA: hypothetical protein VL691_23920 [Vicinamibacteria bacterium]|nr:hypothetical protein [Vicinamibacteria bacterium]
MTPGAARRAVLGLVLVLAPALVGAQGIGDVAAKEKQKRTASPHDKSRVLTNDDLSKGEKSGSPAAAPAAAPASSSGADKERERSSKEQEGNPPADTAVEQAQAAADAARASVVAAEEHVKELQDKLNPMSPSFIYGGTQLGDAVGEEMRTREELRVAEAQLAGARDGLVKANQALEDARRGVRRAPRE